MFQAEYLSLALINQVVEGFAPHPMFYGVLDDDSAYLVTEFVPISGQQDAAAHASIPMHANKGHSRGCYGFPCTTYCGATPQANTPCPDGWSVFWRDKRLRPLLATLEHDQELNRLGHELTPMVPQIIGDDTLITPSLIHGDLWSGNWGIRADTAEAVIFDPAMYFGHHEAEFGIVNMFGGLYNDFYEIYNEAFPPTPERARRVKLYEIYHHLNHYILMDSPAYRHSAIRLMHQLLGH
ncbi:Fructosamine/Ketosamine-3-kinase [Syncephalis pseudoplumigaleata]|uniref:protein-ribulosamine 3-kinase n=1 Tax=Syncephalis pseudoplumigaleata TaxID=1712513 RepID=A0A4P9YU55_9FUNG|nr:Fructosamine/Ketosamine-3-kinase [Syncephalis pseudoplumigaleata]|eukprot:RKP23325.1 Fructosamine/Ketosamine-3-kinase [Syncephalis pseudoplumigaleata]